jgi:uncharacterized DUF497 family protein
MAGLWIEELEIEPHIEDKLWIRHHVTFDEVEDACYEDHTAERTRDGLYLLFNQTSGGRYLAVVLAPRGGGLWAVVTARDMSDAERQRYYRQRIRRGR